MILLHAKTQPASLQAERAETMDDNADDAPERPSCVSVGCNLGDGNRQVGETQTYDNICFPDLNNLF